MAPNSKPFRNSKPPCWPQKQTFIKGFTEKLLCYALGRPIGYGDHMTVDQIVADAAKRDYRLQEIIQAIVASTLFPNRSNRLESRLT